MKHGIEYKVVSIMGISGNSSLLDASIVNANEELTTLVQAKDHLHKNKHKVNNILEIIVEVDHDKKTEKVVHF